MSTNTLQQLKKALVASGFEVFRTQNDEVILAERVRDNLILDSGIRVGWVPPAEDTSVRIVAVFRAQRSDFPSDDEDALYERARKLAQPALDAGFAEVGAAVLPVRDPADPNRTLDTFYEVLLAKNVGSVEAATDELKFALSLEKAVSTAR